MKGKKPFKSRLRRAFAAVAIALSSLGLGTGVEQLPKNPDTDTQKISTFNEGTIAQKGYNISPVDQFWKATLLVKSDERQMDEMRAAADAGDSWRVRAVLEREETSALGKLETLTRGAYYGHADVVQAALDHGADIDAMDNVAFRAAVINGNFDIAHDLLNQSSLSIRALNEALVESAYWGDYAMVDRLFMRGADPAADDSRALLFAVLGGNEDVVRRILQEKKTETLVYAAEPKTYPGYGNAYTTGIPEIDEHRVGAYGRFDPYSTYYLNAYGVMPSWTQGELYTVETTVSKADVNAENGAALRAAVGRGHYDIVRTLVDAGADVNINGGLPLLVAVNANDAKMVALLISLKADPNIGEAKNNANHIGNQDVIDALAGKAPSSLASKLNPPPAF